MRFLVGTPQYLEPRPVHENGWIVRAWHSGAARRMHIRLCLSRLTKFTSIIAGTGSHAVRSRRSRATRLTVWSIRFAIPVIMWLHPTWSRAVSMPQSSYPAEIHASDQGTITSPANLHRKLIDLCIKIVSLNKPLQVHDVVDAFRSIYEAAEISYPSGTMSDAELPSLTIVSSLPRGLPESATMSIQILHLEITPTTWTEDFIIDVYTDTSNADIEELQNKISEWKYSGPHCSMATDAGGLTCGVLLRTKPADHHLVALDWYKGVWPYRPESPPENKVTIWCCQVDPRKSNPQEKTP